MLIEDATASAARPFIGLRPFDYPDRSFFFGRVESIDVVESLVVRYGFVAVIGSSGSGKSSLIRAGLLPRLETRMNEVWRLARPMAPGDAPLGNLARAICSLRPKDELSEAWTENIETRLRRSKFGVPEALSLLPDLAQGGHVVIVVDQFEELFRFADLQAEPRNAAAMASQNRDEATAFVRLLLTADTIPSIRVHVVLTMRSDYIGACSLFYGLPEAVTQHQFLVPGLTRDQRSMAIAAPVQKAGAEIDPELVQRLLNDTNEELDQLPIIQHTMMRCWQSATTRTGAGAPIRVDSDDYRAIGEVENGLSNHANEIFEQFRRFDEEAKPVVSRQLLAKRIFQALTEVDRDGRVIRRPMKFGDLEKYVASSDWGEADAHDAVLSVVVRLAAPDCSFLRITTGDNVDDINDESVVDIGHEALIRRWSKLKGDGETDWVREEQDNGERYRDLVRRARAGSIIPGRELQDYEAWWADRKPTACWATRYVRGDHDYLPEVREALARSRKALDDREREKILAEEARRDAEKAQRRELEAEAARTRATLAEQQAKAAAARAELEAEAARARASLAEQKAKAAAAENALHRQQVRMTAIGAIVAFILFIVAAALGFQYYRTREKYAETLEREESLVATAADGILIAPKLTGAADAANLLTSLPVPAWRKVYFDQVYKTLPYLREVRRVTSLDPAASGRGSSPAIFGVSFNPKAPLLVAVSAGAPPMLYFLKVADRGKVVSLVDKMPLPLKVTGWGSARWSPDGQRLYIGGAGALGAIYIPCASEKLRAYLESCKGKNANERLEIGEIGQPAGIGVWSSDGAQIVTSSFQGQPNVWSASTGKADARLADVVARVVKPSKDPERFGYGSDRTATSLALGSPETQTVAVGDSAGFITVTRSNSNGDASVRLEGPGFAPSQIYFDPVDDNEVLAIYSGKTLLWDIKDGARTPLSHGQGMVMQAAFDPEGRFVVTGSNDGTVRLFGLTGRRVTETVELRGHKGPVFAVDVAPDGTIVSGSADGSVRFWRREPASALSEPRGYGPEDMEKAKRLAADNLPYLDYGEAKIALPNEVLCSFTTNCGPNSL